MSNKPCRKCGAVKPIAEFTVDSRTHDGHGHLCSTCRVKPTGRRKSQGGKSVKARDPKPEAAPPPAQPDVILSLEIARGYGLRAVAEDGVLVIAQDTDGEGEAQIVLSRTEFKVLAAQFHEWSEG